ncbi:hypothetical protein ACWC09_46130, partial [Streptomyces sp. NPDC001617]
RPPAQSAISPNEPSRSWASPTRTLRELDQALLDHGALLRGRIPMAAGAPLWRLVPLPWLQLMRKALFRLV